MQSNGEDLLDAWLSIGPKTVKLDVEAIQGLAIRAYEGRARSLGLPLDHPSILEGMSFEANELSLIGKWAANGYNVFNLTEDLTAALLLTDADVDMSRLNLPFDAFVLRIPRGYIKAPPPYPPTLTDPELAYLLVGYTDPELLKSPNGEVHVMVVGAPVKGELRSIFHVSLSQMFAVLASVRSTGQTGLGSNILPGFTRIDGRVWRLVTGFLSYLNSTSNDSTPGREPHKSKPKPWPKRWIVGGTLKIDHRLKPIARDPDSAATTRSTAREFELKYAHCVRGHYKRQRSGPGLSITERIWIKPYIRGPDEIDPTGARRVYDVNPAR